MKHSVRLPGRSLFIVLLWIGVVFTACSKSRPTQPRTAQLIGTWEQVPDGDPTKGVVVQPRMTFGEDGSLMMELADPRHPVRDTFVWKLDSDDDGLMKLGITHEPDGRHETMAVRMTSADELKVEGKSPATFRRK